MVDGGQGSTRPVVGGRREVGSSTPVPVVVATDEQILDGNEKAVEFFGVDGRGDLVGSSPATLVHAGDRDLARSRIERTIQRNEPPPPTRVRFVDGDGRVRETVATVAPVTAGGQRAARVVLADAPRPTGRSPVGHPIRSS